MYDIIRDVIVNTEYELVDIIKKIKQFWLYNDITTEQYDELLTLARNNAVPDNSYLDDAKQITVLWEHCKALNDRLTVLENAGSAEPPPVTDEWPEYKQPVGSHDSYKTGDKITFQGKQYVCKLDNCVWDPLIYPQGWETVE